MFLKTTTLKTLLQYLYITINMKWPNKLIR